MHPAVFPATLVLCDADIGDNVGSGRNDIDSDVFDRHHNDRDAHRMLAFDSWQYRVRLVDGWRVSDVHIELQTLHRTCE